jgi:hypothetical protein
MESLAGLHPAPAAAVDMDDEPTVQAFGSIRVGQVSLKGGMVGCRPAALAITLSRRTPSDSVG